MAYLRSIEKECAKCLRRATVELIDNYNSVMAPYCAKCGAVKLKELQSWKAVSVREIAGGKA